jgi:hypothetical protein
MERRSQKTEIGGDIQLTDGPNKLKKYKGVENDDTCVTDGQKVGEKKQCGRTCDGLF